MSELAKHRIMAVHITDRLEKAASVQNVLTDHAKIIRTRVGLHDVNEAFCSSNGVLILELLDDDTLVVSLENALNKIAGIEVKSVVFDHP